MQSRLDPPSDGVVLGGKHAIGAVYDCPYMGIHHRFTSALERTCL